MYDSSVMENLKLNKLGEWDAPATRRPHILIKDPEEIEEIKKTVEVNIVQL